MCNCKNGKSYINFLTPAPGNTAEAASYNLGITHYTCGNKKICADSIVSASDLNIQALGSPTLIGNGQYCCDIRVLCTIVYQPLCPCECMKSEILAVDLCVPCGESITGIIPNGAIANPVKVGCGCNSTNEVSLNVSFTVNATA